MKAPLLTSSGRMVDLYNMQTGDIELIDIATSLAKQCRYGGHCKGFYSVAEHSIHLAEHAIAQGNRKLAACLLLHDAAEAYISDMVYHLKRSFPEFQKLDKQITDIVMQRFGYEQGFKDLADEVHRLDRTICIDEMRQLSPYIDPDLANTGYTESLVITMECWEWQEAKERFLRTARKLNII